MSKKKKQYQPYRAPEDFFGGDDVRWAQDHNAKITGTPFMVLPLPLAVKMRSSEDRRKLDNCRIDIGMSTMFNEK